MKKILVSVIFIFLFFYEGISQVAKGGAAKGITSGASAIHSNVTYAGPTVPISVWSIIVAFVIIIALISIRYYRMKAAK
jgi:hypothetical protein